MNFYKIINKISIFYIFSFWSSKKFKFDNNIYPVLFELLLSFSIIEFLKDDRLISSLLNN